MYWAIRKCLYPLLFIILLSTRLSCLANNFAYVTNSGSGNVSVIDTSSNTVVNTISVDIGPVGIAVTPNGSFLYVTNDISNDVSVIAVSSNAVVATVPVGSSPFAVAITPNGNFAYVTNRNSGDVSVIDTSSN